MCQVYRFIFTLSTAGNRTFHGIVIDSFYFTFQFIHFGYIFYHSVTVNSYQVFQIEMLTTRFRFLNENKVVIYFLRYK